MHFVTLTPEDVMTDPHDMLKTLKTAASWLVFIRRGFESGRIPDQTVLDTSNDGATATTRSLSEIIQGQIDSCNAAIKKATPS